MTEKAVVRTDMAVTRRGVEINTISELARVCDALVEAGIAPKGMTNKQALGTVIYGMEMGLTPAFALQSIAFINGRPSLYGDGLQALLLSSGQLAKMPDEYFQGSGQDLTAVCVMHRKGISGAIARQYSWRDAQAAGLTGKQVWQQHPRRMLRWRAFSMAARDGFADILRGLNVQEVVEDDAPQVTIDVAPPPVPAEPPAPQDANVAPDVEVATPAPPPPPPPPLPDENECFPAAPPPPPPAPPDLIPPQNGNPPTAEKTRVSVTPTVKEAPAEAPEEEADEGEDEKQRRIVWSSLKQMRNKLTEEQFAAAKASCGMQRAYRTAPLEKLEALADACEQIIAESEEV